MKNKHFIVGFVSALAVSVSLLGGCQVNNVNDAVNNVMSLTNEKADAYRVACDLVRDQLNAPSSAVFPSYQSSFVSGSDGDYTVSAYVEGENLVGGTSKVNWTATVKAISDNKFHVEITSIE